MAIEIEEKEKNYKNSVGIFILIFLLLAFLAFLGSYFYFLISKKNIKKELSQIENNIKQKEKEINPLEEEVLNYKKKFKDFKSLIALHRFPTKFFTFLEDNTHPGVWFNSLDFNLETGSLKVSGESLSFEVLAQQILILKNQEFVKNITLSRAVLGKEGKISFDLELTLDSKLYQ